MKITRIDLWHVAVPLPAPFRPSWIPGMAQTENRFDLIRLTTSEGIHGWSAAPRMGAERSGLGALLGPYLLNERADDIASIRQRIREMSYLGWRIGWVEAACWDIVGKARNKPVYELLGGKPGKVKCYASTGTMRTGAERVPEVLARMDEGFEVVKLRVHADTLEEDCAQLIETRKGVGDTVKLGVDANQGWRVAVIGGAPKWDYDRALAFCRVAEEQGLSWVEEPLPNDDYEAMAKLRAATDIPISGGELNSQGLPEFKVMLGKKCLDWYQPDAVMTGGLSETYAIMKHITAAGAKYTPHTWTNGVGFAINLQVFAASHSRDIAWLEYPLDPPGWIPERRDAPLMTPWTHDKGMLELPTLPGLGFEIDPRMLRRYGKRYFVADKLRVSVRAVMDRGISEARALGAVRDARLEKRNAELEAAGGDPALDALKPLMPKELPASD